ncbi:MAG: hypothetical protein AAF657_29605 [Acidobacteriota bacterium]
MLIITGLLISFFCLLVLSGAGWLVDLLAGLVGWELTPEQAGGLFAHVCLFALTWGWLSQWLWRIWGSKSETDRRRSEAVTANWVPLIVWSCAMVLLEAVRRSFYAEVVVIAGLASLVLMIALLKHDFAGNWSTPLYAVPLSIVAGYSLLAWIEEAGFWEIEVGSWPWFFSSGVFLILSIQALEKGKRLLASRMAERGC